MPSDADASKGLIAALKGNDQETLAAAIEACSGFDNTPGDDRQRLRGTASQLAFCAAKDYFQEEDDSLVWLCYCTPLYNIHLEVLHFSCQDEAQEASEGRGGQEGSCCQQVGS